MSAASRTAVLVSVVALVGVLALDGLRAMLGDAAGSHDERGAAKIEEVRTDAPREIDTNREGDGEPTASAPESESANSNGADPATDSDPAAEAETSDAASDASREAGADSDDSDAVEHDAARAVAIPVVEPGAEPPPPDRRFDAFPGKRLAKGPWVVPRSALAERLRASLADKRLATAKVAVAVVAADDGAVVFAKDADEPLIVASNNKLLTTAAALRVLGANFEFRTRLCATGALAGGTVAGDLIVIGDGDPDVLPGSPNEKASLAGRIAAALLAAGVKRVSGDLVIDDLVFDRRYLPPQWRKDQLAHDYAAPVSGFSLYENCLVVMVKPSSKVGALAGVSLLPNSSVLAPDVSVKTGGAKAKNSIYVPAPVAPGKVKVSGQTPHGASPVPLFLPLADPGATHPAALKDALTRAGIAIDGKARLAEKRVDAVKLREVAVVTTPFSAVLHKLNKDSSNPLAEHVYKRIGFAAHGAGTYVNAGKAVLETLSHHGIDATGAASADGSGLSRGNTFTARQLALVLRAMWQGPGRSLVVDSLPISGVDGTMSKRLAQEAYKGRVRAKTGYIAGVSTLSGYAASESGEVFCFSVLVNNVKGATAAKAVQDAIAKVLADVGPKAP